MGSVKSQEGARAELRFMEEAIARGFSVCRPFVDRAYDFLLEKQGRFCRVQVKSTSIPAAKDGSFKFSTYRGASKSTKYTKDDIDVFAFYIGSLNSFYIVPVEKIDQVTIRIYPHKSDHALSSFQGNWYI